MLILKDLEKSALEIKKLLVRSTRYGDGFAFSRSCALFDEVLYIIVVDIICVLQLAGGGCM